MKNEYKWNVTVEGEKYLVRCVPYKTVFDVYVDGDLVEHVGRDDSDGLDTEYDIKIAGKKCQLTLYGGELDLCVDGVLLGAEREMKRREIRNRILLVLGGLAASTASAITSSVANAVSRYCNTPYPAGRPSRTPSTVNHRFWLISRRPILESLKPTTLSVAISRYRSV